VALSGGRIDTFLAGTSTPVATYSDNLGTSYGTSITLDSTGRTPYGWYGDQDVAYKIRVYNAASSEQTQYQQDNITFPATASTLESFHLQRGRSDIGGTNNNYDLDGIATNGQTEISYWQWNGITPCILTGMAGGVDGRMVYGENISPDQYLWLRHNNSSSTAANRFRTDSTNGQYIGAGGSWQMIYDATALVWDVTVLNPGAMISPTYASGDYTAADWTVLIGQVTTRGFQQQGTLLHVAVTITGATAAGARPLLTQIIPGGFTASLTQQAGAVATNAATIVPAYMQVGLSAASASLSGVLIPAGNWTAGSVTLSSSFMITVD